MIFVPRQSHHCVVVHFYLLNLSSKYLHIMRRLPRHYEINYAMKINQASRNDVPDGCPRDDAPDVALRNDVLKEIPNPYVIARHIKKNIRW